MEAQLAMFQTPRPARDLAILHECDLLNVSKRIYARNVGPWPAQASDENLGQRKPLQGNFPCVSASASGIMAKAPNIASTVEWHVPLHNVTHEVLFHGVRCLLRRHAERQETPGSGIGSGGY